MKRFDPLAMAAVVGLGLAVYMSVNPVVQQQPQPKPAPQCPDDKCPAPEPPLVVPEPAPRRPWAALPSGPVGSPRGRNIGDVEPMVDALSMPQELRPHNCGGRDGAGLCVFTSIMYAARYENEPKLKQFQSQMKNEPGGGYPGKVDKMIAKYGPGAKYIQYEGDRVDLIELALKTGRLPCITWQGNHMLNCVFLDKDRAAILDNNDPHRLHWYDRKTFVSKYSQGGGWTFVLLAPAPTPPPSNLPKVEAGRGDLIVHGDEYEWRKGHNPGNWLLHKDGVQVGLWFDGKYEPLVNGRFGKACEPPIEPPSAEMPGVTDEGWTNRGQGERWKLNGREVSAEEANKAFGGSVEDDSERPFLTVIGPDTDRAKVIADVEAMADYKGKLRLQSYDPKEWAVSPPWGFVTAGKPVVIYVQAANGKVLHHQDDYAGGAAALAKAIGDATGLRKPDPNYQPAKDPDRRKNDPMAPLQDVPAASWAAALAAAYALIRKGQHV